MSGARKASGGEIRGGIHRAAARERQQPRRAPLTSNLVDRFICRREGHIPTMKLVKTSGINVETYITSCVRCGKVYEVSNTESSHE